LRERPVGRELFEVIKADEIVVAYRIDRFSRNTPLGLADIDELRQRGVGLLIAADHRGSPPAGDELDPMDVLRTWPEIIESTFDRVKYEFTTASAYHIL